LHKFDMQKNALVAKNYFILLKLGLKIDMKKGKFFNRKN